jgi:hypothetical protein
VRRVLRSGGLDEAVEEEEAPLYVAEEGL